MVNFQTGKIKKIGREALIIIIGIFAVIYIIRTVQAGSLTPSASPASTLKTLQEVYDPLVGTSHDSSSVVAGQNGDALQIMKCIISKLNTGSCP
ncbi:MAG: hypothetical protein A3I26_00220 [Candidatus Yanofskybacteria bacterium RIFCSPLOWO2_02_FULL_43_10]|uniref:Uncharacterized protein n=1 Tax=Candidatus Yanofskybacteria bacterium RIFCSPLOWO2_12_FULL_43_11b TaxID=1802710 RepID=A0A1F8H9Y9_9BACT|nr:MAG: hypothetical protein A2742_00440 [Candidatus Yanofskybacteria bacterium RIFCSPHIGHO2_01_FULL_43_32]OGN11025.1 MAG: hypothetical protein A3C69_03570 [Candidatus Yanofskybacteria bacterium RIFCSPHIGHO2_02_FULL_43_12]OGN17884.1 MAG: hypothetical protein A3E34_00410 [Candidatus Yanofskybacteria bacterium RIFCSPHIGHO2_12_FULL_43_11]OGN24155.1 MAG: hypothetical protein A2923_02380 [Candidatus Yanofskybacteria bacterium RIFCSPLOWO2_01_FULL_43_46]OGN30530.1 MAG: hypothetical protein A3I26_00220